MASCVNRVQLIGFCGGDANIASTQNGTITARLSLATSSRFKNKAGESQDRTEWHNLVAFGRKAEIIRDYVRKGSYLYVEGELRTRSWTDDKEVKRYRTEIIISNIQLLDRASSGSNTATSNTPVTVPDDTLEDDFSDIPF